MTAYVTVLACINPCPRSVLASTVYEVAAAICQFSEVMSPKNVEPQSALWYACCAECRLGNAGLRKQFYVCNLHAYARYRSVQAQARHSFTPFCAVPGRSGVGLAVHDRHMWRSSLSTILSHTPQTAMQRCLIVSKVPSGPLGLAPIRAGLRPPGDQLLQSTSCAMVFKGQCEPEIVSTLNKIFRRGCILSQVNVTPLSEAAFPAAHSLEVLMDPLKVPSYMPLQLSA